LQNLVCCRRCWPWAWWILVIV